MIDQAAELRNLVAHTARRTDAARQRAPRLVVLMGGKGGVGVTTLAVNLSVALIAERYRVVLVDADLYRADVALLCHLHDRRNISNVLSGAQTLADVMQPGPGGIHVVPGIWAPDHQPTLDKRRGQRLLKQIRQLGPVADIVLLDAGNSGADIVHHTRPAMQDALLVTTPDAVAVMDCYATIKTALRTDHTAMPVTDGANLAPGTIGGSEATLGLITNQVENVSQARDVHGRIDYSTRRFLNTEIANVGAVPRDAALPRAATMNEPLILTNPDAPAARAIREIAARLAARWRQMEPSGRNAVA